ncbi:DNA polymerase IV [Mucilaginibacter rubeus]|uniref:DNA-directed DNA polymerase n=1 Tax=Mucilaginibacter rubeus TaxID=2027860 RepID=A0AAE6MHB5_9SPHI|nr:MULTISPECIES: DNA polymerase IV [Mucilaginibacter]QEM03094.1 DNA polymerase IV [Mucilaginibacter rubeus]QEM15713.1 DNA polymerase IV [Mucilaginibacter gossypii]QTE41548.1 DNA polymerase IV [Mucilaginibacter rubeus]QTE48154.1 DNA polymerase IV [Mucilaginibacter rubeus]QTE59545.1 DNA polymerase IV [Mucilaginibacter rubeus]
MDRDLRIVHINLDNLPLAVEVLKNRELANKPVVIAGNSERGIVTSCSPEARRFGVRPGMPTKVVKQFCRDAVMIRGNEDEYSKYSDTVTDVLLEQAPLLEKSTLQEHYIDMSGMDRFQGCLQWNRELQQFVKKETGLGVSFGLSVNKTVARIATFEAQPLGAKVVRHPEIQPFLDPLSIYKIPGIGDKTGAMLEQMGAELIGTLAQVPLETLEDVFGKPGHVLWQRAHGLDDRPLIPYKKTKELYREQLFQPDTIDVDLLRRTVTRMVMEMAHQLRLESKVTSCIKLKITYTDFETVTKQSVVAYTASNDILIGKTHQVLDTLWQKRKMIRLVAVSFTKIMHGYEQTDIFEHPDKNKSKQQAAIDKIWQRYGTKSLTLASALK